jgi:hypothetical protein
MSVKKLILLASVLLCGVILLFWRPSSLPGGLRFISDRNNSAIVDRDGWVLVGSNRYPEGAVETFCSNSEMVVGVTKSGAFFRLDLRTKRVLVFAKDGTLMRDSSSNDQGH